MALVIHLSAEQEASLERRAAELGLAPGDYARAVLERDLHRPFLEDSLAPFRQQVEASGITDEELDTLFEEARVEVFQQKRSQRP